MSSTAETAARGSLRSSHGPEVSLGPSGPHQNHQFTRETLWGGTPLHQNHPSIHFGGKRPLVFAVLVDASEGWPGVRMKPYLEQRLRQIAKDPQSTWEDSDLARLAA